MATHEEVQKKINEALERMSDEELDRVAGGTWSENQDLLVAMGNVDPDGLMNLFKSWDQNSATLGIYLKSLIDKNFKNRGLNVEYTPGIDPNKYKIDGEPASHEKFIDYLNTVGSWEVI